MLPLVYLLSFFFTSSLIAYSMISLLSLVISLVSMWYRFLHLCCYYCRQHSRLNSIQPNSIIYTKNIISLTVYRSVHNVYTLNFYDQCFFYAFGGCSSLRADSKVELDSTFPLYANPQSNEIRGKQLRDVTFFFFTEKLFVLIFNQLDEFILKWKLNSDMYSRIAGGYCYQNNTRLCSAQINPSSEISFTANCVF